MTRRFLSTTLVLVLPLSILVSVAPAIRGGTVRVTVGPITGFGSIVNDVELDISNANVTLKACQDLSDPTSV
jgi:hypothetical protein